MNKNKIKKTRSFLANWVCEQQKTLGISSLELAELTGKPASTISEYRLGRRDTAACVVFALVARSENPDQALQKIYREHIAAMVGARK